MNRTPAAPLQQGGVARNQESISRLPRLTKAGHSRHSLVPIAHLLFDTGQRTGTSERQAGFDLCKVGAEAVEEARVELDELSGVPLFADLEPRSLAMLVREARVEAAPARTCLFKEGKKPEMLHVLLAGSVQLSAAFAREARETVIEVASAPDCFILAAVLTDTPYLMSATVLEPARLLLLPAAGFRRDIASNPDLSLILLASLACQSRRMVRQLKNLKLRSTVQRLGCFLLTLSTPPR